MTRDIKHLQIYIITTEKFWKEVRLLKNMSTILDKIAAYTAKRIALEKKVLSLSEIKQRALMTEVRGDFHFEKALSEEGISFICECKKASPSKGLIAPDFDYLQIAKDYELAGASCISVLTEPKLFLGGRSPTAFPSPACAKILRLTNI